MKMLLSFFCQNEGFSEGWKEQAAGGRPIPGDIASGEFSGEA